MQKIHIRSKKIQRTRKNIFVPNILTLKPIAIIFSKWPLKYIKLW